ncbi:hypothetical protein HanRHA438_Chr14g0630571 [Helianthus annuus]|uniref:Uncharacterized protein n=1 Tax=Helianthus annuus TaxID=4232 RepID=A0A251SH40_HELAN|nr:hypothetical protein HanXRQr2_Chr14g0620741 [Helianthus annuus]KAJ0838500.1 hypothetical protein HanPSC8_Chr14g0595551 [Helianthus annuus]KAJ0851755.1 hypothetical protein HanRHA438_Chr14g0630571 [Helianthus annuus]
MESSSTPPHCQRSLLNHMVTMKGMDPTHYQRLGGNFVSDASVFWYGNGTTKSKAANANAIDGV